MAAFVRTLLSVLLLASGAVMAQMVTVPLIVEGNAPIVELEFASDWRAPSRNT